MANGRSYLIAGLAILLLVSVVGGAWSTERADAVEGCGADATLDWLCREAGEVELGREPVRGSAPFQVVPRTRVWVGGTAVARMAFGQEANCELGGVAKPTVIVSRYRGSLFLQRNGSTTCWRLTGGSPFGVFCKRTVKCPLEVFVDGSVRTEWKPRPAAARLRSSPASAEIVLWICAGSYRVAAQRNEGNGGSSVRASGEFIPPQLSVVRIVESAFGLSIHGESTGEYCDPGA